MHTKKVNFYTLDRSPLNLNYVLIIKFPYSEDLSQGFCLFPAKS